VGDQSIADNKKIDDFFKKNPVHFKLNTTHQIDRIDADDSVLNIYLNSGDSIKVIFLSFKQTQEIEKHFYQRRQMLFDSFKSFIEPYYGLVERKQCVDFAKAATDMKKEGNKIEFSARLPANKDYTLFDCASGQPAFSVEYYFIGCLKEKIAYETRYYRKESAQPKQGHSFSMSCD
jgi:hypothetical protein